MGDALYECKERETFNTFMGDSHECVQSFSLVSKSNSLFLYRVCWVKTKIAKGNRNPQ